VAKAGGGVTGRSYVSQGKELCEKGGGVKNGGGGDTSKRERLSSKRSCSWGFKITKKDGLIK